MMVLGLDGEMHPATPAQLEVRDMLWAILDAHPKLTDNELVTHLRLLQLWAPYRTVH